MDGRFSISRAWESSRERLASDSRLLVAVALALVLLPQTLVGTLAPPPQLSGQEQPGWAGLLALAAGLLGIVGQIALIRLALDSRMSVRDAILHGVRRMPVLLVSLILIGVALLVLLVPLALVSPGLTNASADNPRAAMAAAGPILLLIIILMLALSPKFQLIVPTASAEPVGPIALLKRSWALSGGHYWRLLGFVVLLLVMGLLLIMPAQLLAGVIVKILFASAEPLSMGALVFALIGAAAQTAFILVAALMLAFIYAQLAGPASGEASVPPTSGT